MALEDQHGLRSGVDNNNNSILGLFSLATAGLNGPDLGSDEEDIVFISIVLINHKKVLLRVSFPVRPGANSSNESHSVPDPVKSEFKLTDEMMESAQGLQQVLEQIDTLLHSTLDDTLDDLILLTDGQLPLRQCLHPQANTKGIQLPNYFNSFIDLRKECGKVYGISDSISSVTKHLNLEIDETAAEDPVEIGQMTAIVQHMINEGHTFDEREYIQLILQPGLCSRSDEVDGESVVRARGLPWQSSDADIATFFRGLNIAKGGVALCLSPQGRRNGEALVRFENQAFRDMALKRHKHHIGNRYIEVYRAGGEDFLAVAGGSNNEAQAFLTKGGQVIIRMRGLPYDCTNKQVVEFFRGGSASASTSGSSPDGESQSGEAETDQQDSGSARPLEVLDGEGGVLFVRRPDGRATGDAFVLFAEEADAVGALAKHRECIGSRYIELFRSTTAEVQQVLNRCLESLKLDSPIPQLNSPQQQQLQPSPPQQQQQPPIPQHMITAGTRKDCVRLRGLPYEAQVEHILEFLGDHAKNIVFQGVHMVYNAQGQPSGEAFIQMDSESSAFTTASSKHHRYMMYFKKQRYIEVFQCSGEDMNCVLTGALSPKPSPAPPGILSYGHHVYPTLIPAPVPSHPRPVYLTYWPSFNSTPHIPSNPANFNYHLNTTHMSLDCVGGSGGLGKPLLTMTDNPAQHHHHLHHHTHQRYVGGTAPNYDFDRALDKHHHNGRGVGPPGGGAPTKNYMELGLFIA